ncbi:hypothetical protein DFJ58DRAFT_910696 [Suillus subalutaceus]|uniref:uncharacterized protein n=1 Tax=Suillus subalutaceus TaxID=48586 RepID=UPI001B8832AF|nr:uncharacterized protein DFJ58DRAFT_910696 [Suillus subalutaceus]KAG1872405.1 hypothetical protein DFJ58DRAFT_910696 [Suillus subalutaceus]
MPRPSESWILPGRTSLAFSRTLNPRNVEFLWYPLWDQTLSDLVADVSNLIVAPQFPVWFVPVDDPEGENDGDDPEEILVQPFEKEDSDSESAASENQDDHEQFGIGAGRHLFHIDRPGEGCCQRHSVAQPQPVLKARYGGWRITAASVGLLVEVKRFCSRSLAGDELEAEILSRVVEASADLVNQAAHVFLQDPNRNSMLALAAAGPYWRSAKIHRTEVYGTMHNLATKDPNYQAPGEHRPDREPKWNSIIRVDLARSRDRLRTIHNNLVNMGVLGIPSVHSDAFRRKPGSTAKLLPAPPAISTCLKVLRCSPLSRWVFQCKRATTGKGGREKVGDAHEQSGRLWALQAAGTLWRRNGGLQGKQAGSFLTRARVWLSRTHRRGHGQSREEFIDVNFVTTSLACFPFWRLRVYDRKTGNPIYLNVDDWTVKLQIDPSWVDAAAAEFKLDTVSRPCSTPASTAESRSSDRQVAIEHNQGTSVTTNKTIIATYETREAAKGKEEAATCLEEEETGKGGGKG